MSHCSQPNEEKAALDTRVLKALAAIIRPINLCIIIITAVFAVYYFQISPTVTMGIIGMLFASIAASGYIINDIFDIEIDVRNRPTRPLPSRMISVQTAWIWYAMWIIFAMILTVYLYSLTIIFAILCVYLTIYYATKAKITGVWGNLIVAFLTASPIIAVALEGEVTALRLLVPAGCAFLITLTREIVKDCEDMEGDAQVNSKSIPLSLGIQNTRYIILGLTIGLCCFTLAMRSSATKILLYDCIVIGVVTILMTVAYASVRKERYSNASVLYKVAMIVGIGGLWLSR